MPALAELPAAHAVARWYQNGALDVSTHWEEFVDAVERISPGWFLGGDPSLCPCRLVDSRPVPSAADVAMQLSCWVALGLLGAQHDRPLGQVLVEAGPDTWTLRLRLEHDRNRAPRIVGTLVTLRTEDAREVEPIHPIERVTAAFLRWSSRRYKREKLRPEDLGIGVPDEDEREGADAGRRRPHRPDRPRQGKPGGPERGKAPARAGTGAQQDGETAASETGRTTADAAAEDAHSAGERRPADEAHVADGGPVLESPDGNRDGITAAAMPHVDAMAEQPQASVELAGVLAVDMDAEPQASVEPSGGLAADVDAEPNASTSDAIHADLPPEGVPEASTSGTTT